MDWNSKILGMTPFVSQPAQTFTNFLFNSNFDPFPEVKQLQGHHEVGMMETIPTFLDSDILMSYGSQERRIRRLTTNQLESLESSFQEERKLEPSRKMKLAKELGLQPRQVAVWFQNRRARWKAKKLEHLYDALKQENDLVSKENHRLQEEVVRLKSKLMELTTRSKQVSACDEEDSGDGTVESTTFATQCSNKHAEVPVSEHHLGKNYVFNFKGYNSVSPSYWGAF